MVEANFSTGAKATLYPLEKREIAFATILPRLASCLYVLYSVFVTSLAAILVFTAAKADYALYAEVGPRIDTV